MGYIADYGANAKSQAQLDALTKAQISDFRLGLTWSFARRIGETNTGSPEAPVFEDRFELNPRTVQEITINQDLLDFQNDIRLGNAYSPAQATTTTTAP